MNLLGELVVIGPIGLPLSFMPKRKWRRFDDAALDPSQGLVRCLLKLHGSNKLSAKSCCILAHHAVCAGARGDSLRRLAYNPAKSHSGNFQRHLNAAVDKIFPDAKSFFHQLTVPCYIKGKRRPKRIPVASAYDSLEQEVIDNDEAHRALHATQWGDSYETHPLRHLVGDTRDVFPVGFYMDAVRCTKQTGAGKQDSLIAMTCFNLATQRRHVLCTLAKRELCKCGCAGVCTLWGAMNYLRFVFAAAARGERPGVDWNGDAWMAGSTEASRATLHPRLAARFIVTEVRCDWGEMCASLGFHSWQSTHRACPFCLADKVQMQDMTGVTMHGHQWGYCTGEESYDNACRRCEVAVNLQTEADRQLILDVGGLDYREGGRVLNNDVPQLHLRKKDVLVASASLHDVGDLEAKPLPVTVFFWRANFDDRSRRTDHVNWRNPLFGLDTGISPARHLMPDLLHVCYLGVFQRFVARIIWESIDANLWHVAGGRAQVEDGSVEFIWADIRSWYRRKQVPHNRRLTQLTRSMVGNRATHDLKTKGAETGVLVAWATDFATRMVERLAFGHDLAAAGGCLVRYMDILCRNCRIMPWSERQALLNECLRHNVLIQQSEGTLTPKHHMWVHLTQAANTANPREFATWLDESLNAILSTVAQGAHRTTWEKSIFRRIRLLSLVQPDSYFATI